MDHENKLLAEAGLTFSTFAACALPPPGGFILAGALATLNFIVSACAGGEDNSSQFIESLSLTLKTDLEHEDINLAVSTFSGYAVWLKEYHRDVKIPEKLLAGDDALAYAEFMSVYTNLQRAVTDPGQPLRNWLQNLMRIEFADKGASFSTRSLCAFLYGAAVFAAFSKIYIMINSTAFQAIDKVALEDFCADMERFTKHASTVLEHISEQRNQRRTSVTEGHTARVSVPGLGNVGTVSVIVVQDNEDFYRKPDLYSTDEKGTFMSQVYVPSSMPENTVYIHEVFNDAKQADEVLRSSSEFRNDYLAKADLLVDDLFFGENRDSMEQTLAGLVTSLDNARTQLSAT